LTERFVGIFYFLNILTKFFVENFPMENSIGKKFKQYNLSKNKKIKIFSDKKNSVSIKNITSKDQISGPTEKFLADKIAIFDGLVCQNF